VSGEIPGVVEIDCVGGIVISNAYDGMAFNIKHHRSAGVDLSFILGERKASCNGIVCFLAVTICYYVSSGLVEKFSSISTIFCTNSIPGHGTAGQR
jgi:hypothetical protein